MDALNTTEMFEIEYNRKANYAGHRLWERAHVSGTRKECKDWLLRVVAEWKRDGKNLGEFADHWRMTPRSRASQI